MMGRCIPFPPPSLLHPLGKSLHERASLVGSVHRRVEDGRFGRVKGKRRTARGEQPPAAWKAHQP